MAMAFSLVGVEGRFAPTFARSVTQPKIVSIVEGNPSAALTAADPQALGFAVVLYAVTPLFAATRAVQQALATLHADGRPRQVLSLAYADFTRVVGLAAHQALDERCGA